MPLQPGSGQGLGPLYKPAFRKHAEGEDFDVWMKAVDAAVTSKVGLSVYDLADCAFRDWFDAGMTPNQAANACIRNDDTFGMLGYKAAVRKEGEYREKWPCPLCGTKMTHQKNGIYRHPKTGRCSNDDVDLSVPGAKGAAGKGPDYEKGFQAGSRDARQQPSMNYKPKENVPYGASMPKDASPDFKQGYHDGYQSATEVHMGKQAAEDSESPFPPLKKKCPHCGAEQARPQGPDWSKKIESFRCEKCGRTFQLMKGSAKEAASGEEEFFNAYVAAAIWSSMTDSGEPLDAKYDRSDLDAQSLSKMRADCNQFIQQNQADLEEMGDYSQAGHDFWLTRNGHGAGFWDRGLGPLGERLSDAARAFGESYIFESGDGLMAEGSKQGQGFGYDPELPAGFQEADFEMRELEEAAERNSNVKCPRCKSRMVMDEDGGAYKRCRKCKYVGPPSDFKEASKTADAFGPGTCPTCKKDVKHVYRHLEEDHWGTQRVDRDNDGKVDRHSNRQSQMQERMAALESLTQYGPNYSRNVRAALDDARRFLSRGELDHAERFLLTAEMRAGKLSFEEWQAATAALEGKLFEAASDPTQKKFKPEQTGGGASCPNCKSKDVAEVGPGAQEGPYRCKNCDRWWDTGKDAKVAAMKPVRDLQIGDLVDLEGDQYAGAEVGNSSAEFELAQVVEETVDEGTAILVHFDQGSFGFPPDHQLPLGEAGQEEKDASKQAAMKEPWNLCGICDADFNSWPHRINHFKKNHAGEDPKQDYTGKGGVDRKPELVGVSEDEWEDAARQHAKIAMATYFPSKVADEGEVRCPDCNGNGTKKIPLMDEFDEYVEEWVERHCDMCGGSGKVDAIWLSEMKFQYGPEPAEW